MTATATNPQKDMPASEPLSMADGGRMILRGAQRLIGASLTLAALGLWLAPGASWESDVMLFKLILSITAVLAGIGFMSASGRPRAPEVEIDTIRREVRVIRKMRGAAPVILQSCKFSKLSRAEQAGPVIRLWDKGGQFLAEVALTDRQSFANLVAGLRDEGKLA